MLADILSDFHVFIAVLCVTLLVFLIIGIIIGRIVQRTKDIFLIKKERMDAVKRSRSVLGGLVGEQLAPFLPDFPCNPGDVRFIGKPIDFIAFPGISEGRHIKDVLFIEVKSGESRLSEREREIKAAVKAGRVHYVEYRIPTDEM
ncbi:MAG: Holliday junction resolvase [Treponema sp.]|nr:Holliday junction resolvase [Treponema sp.]